MCGRYTINIGRKRFEAIYQVQAPLEFAPRFNVAPTQRVPIIRQDASGLEATMLAWGITSHNKPIINARSETALEKPLFKDAMRNRRCIVPASGWYEWREVDGKKQAYHLKLENQEAMAFAGIWTQDQFSILITSANKAISHIHNRMPVILSRERWQVWLSNTSLEQIETMLESYDSRVMDAYPVSNSVGNVKNDEMGLIEPLS